MRKFPESKPFLSTIESYEIKLKNELKITFILKIEPKSLRKGNSLEDKYCLKFYKITEINNEIKEEAKEIFELVFFRQNIDFIDETTITRLDLGNLKEIFLEIKSEFEKFYKDENELYQAILEFCEQIFLMIDKLRLFFEVDYERIKQTYIIILNLIKEYSILNYDDIQKFKKWLNIQQE